MVSKIIGYLILIGIVLGMSFAMHLAVSWKEVLIIWIIAITGTSLIILACHLITN